MIKVGVKVYTAKYNYKRISYKAVTYDIDGWADATEYLPRDGDLMFIKVSGEPKGCGWVWGKRWEGMRLKKGDIVTHWKRNLDKEVMKDER